MTHSHDTPTVHQVREALKSVIDPEVGVNIVDLGLVYEVDVSDARITVEMTMTTPACPMVPMIMDDVTATLRSLAPEMEPNILMVWEPEWHPGMMSDEAKQHFGWKI